VYAGVTRTHKLGLNLVEMLVPAKCPFLKERIVGQGVLQCRREPENWTLEIQPSLSSKAADPFSN
jgi:hypothetical protein